MRADLYGEDGVPQQRTAARPGNVAAATFPLVRRGYDPTQVNWYLQGLAEDLADYEDRCSQLDEQVTALQRELQGATRIDEVSVASFLGDESSRLLFDARDVAHRLISRAESRSAKILDAARTSAQDTLSGAERESARLRRTTTEEVTRLKRDVETETTGQRKDIDATARNQQRELDAFAAHSRQETKEVATAMLHEAQSEAQRIVADAEAERSLILADLDARQKTAATELNILLSGRDAVLASLTQVMSTAHSLTTDLESHRAPDAPVTGPTTDINTEQSAA